MYGVNPNAVISAEKTEPSVIVQVPSCANAFVGGLTGL